MFRIHMLPAMFGDCLWVDYGNPDDPNVILIDAGTAGTWKPLLRKIEDRIEKTGKPLVIELFVVTHVDRDHIGGAIKFMEQLRNLNVTIREVWFNGWHHLNGEVPPEKRDGLGAVDGEHLTALLRDSPVPWNGLFERGAVVAPATGELPQRTIAGMELILLSPDQDKLDKLIKVWMNEVLAEGVVPGDAFEVETPPDLLGKLPVDVLAGYPFECDDTEANGSSIAFLATFEEKTILFGADAHPDLLVKNLARVKPSKLKGGIAALKVSHHGSKGNTNDELVSLLQAEHYLVSTNGSIYSHPDDEAIARIIVLGPAVKQLHFNYDRPTNRRWADEEDEHGYTTRYGTDTEGLIVDL